MPTQQVTAATQINPTPREVLQASRTYYVRTDGSDLNNGLTDTSAGAFLTEQKAIDAACSLDLSIYSVSIYIRSGTWNENLNLKPYVGVGPIYLIGDTTTPANVAQTGTITALRFAREWHLKGFKHTSLVVAYPGSFVVVDGNTEFGTGSSHHLWAYGGLIQIATAYTISGPPAAFCAHFYSTNGGYIYSSGAFTVTIQNNPAWGWSFAFARETGRIESSGVTYSGACTGQRYYVDLNGVIQTFGSGANYFPGNVAGATATGGQYA